MTEKWTQELRRIAFARLAMELGRDYWIRKGQLPLHHEDAENNILQQIAQYLTWMTGTPFTAKNIEAQLAWAKTAQGEVRKTQAKQYILCKSAALEVGLISNQPSDTTTLGS